jgi:PAS domain S-box-containing protein
MRRCGIVSPLILPLIIEGEVIGNLGIASQKQRSFSDEEINLAWRVTNQVAGVLARARLDQDRRRLATIIEQSAESVIVTDTEGTILYVNPTFERVSGYSRAEIVGQNPRILKSGKHDDAYYRDLWATINAGKVWQGSFVNKKKDGSLYTTETIISPVQDESGAIVNYVGIQRDVTHELELEEQYYQAQKMEAIGRLAGGVAHDFNNLLTAVMGYAGLALNTLSPDHSVYSDLQDIQITARRATDLTRQLLIFASRQIVTSQILNLNDLILNLEKLLRRLISESIELVILPASELGQIKADPTQIEQVLVNLVVNARDAMPEGGKLIIETGNFTLEEDYAGHPAEMTPGEYVMLAVSDTGMGMTEEIKAHIFEPFFTTKETGKGTGLGLATCFGITKQCNGHIRVYSELNQGTTFRVFLPRIEEETGTLTTPDKSQALPRGTETVLVVEDEESVRNLAIRTLCEQGYTVLEATNGEEALSLAQEYGQKEIHLLFTDLIMPRLGGQALADRLQATHPGISVLFTSGYTDNICVDHGVPDTDTSFLPKPFSPADLARKVREVLDAAVNNK